MASVEVRNVRKAFGKREALKGISLGVADGELFCLLGPPGAGKTTLLRIIAGLERPDEGEVFLGGMSVKHVPPQERDVAMIFEDVALYPHLTGFGNIAYPLRLRKFPKEEVEKRVREVAARLHIEHILNRHPATFSGGELRRVAIGRALVRRPRVLLLDQPFTDLDAKVRQEMTAELKHLQTEVGQTMILATHDFEEGMIADRIAVMHLGEVHQVAPPKEVYELPATTFVAQFVGNPAMNLFLCRLEPKEEGYVAVHSAFSVLLPGRPESMPLKVWLGIRPERIVSAASGDIRAEVEVVQILGDEQIVDLILPDGTRFKWVVPLAVVGELHRGNRVQLRFPGSAIVLFDGSSGRLIFRKEV